MHTVGLAVQSVFSTLSKFIFMQTVPVPASPKEYVCTLGDDILVLQNKNGIIGLSSRSNILGISIFFLILTIKY